MKPFASTNSDDRHVLHLYDSVLDLRDIPEGGALILSVLYLQGEANTILLPTRGGIVVQDLFQAEGVLTLVYSNELDQVADSGLMLRCATMSLDETFEKRSDAF